MTLRIEGQPFLLQFAIWACVAVFVVSFIAGFCGLLLAYSRLSVLANRMEDKKLSWGERLRQSSRANNFFIADEFRLLRRVIFSAWAGAIMSFGLLALLIVLFGERTSP